MVRDSRGPAGKRSGRFASGPANPRLLTALVAAGLLGAGVMGGCENPAEKADKSVRSGVEDAQKPPAKGSEPGTRPAVIAQYETLAKTAGATDVPKIDVRMRQAQAEIAAADALMHQVADLQVRAARLIGDARAMAVMIRINNAYVAGLNKLNPDAAKKAIGESTTLVKAGGADGNWVAGSPDGAIPAQTATDAKVTELTAKVDKLKQDKTRLEKERDESTQQADQLDEQARRLKGQKALDLGIQAATLRSKSRKAQLDGEMNDLALSRAEKDLTSATERQKVIVSAVGNLDARAKSLDAAWAETEKQIKARSDHSARLLGKADDSAGDAGTSGSTGGADAGGPTTAPAKVIVTQEMLTAEAAGNSITAKAKQVAALTADADAKRDQALQLYEAAAQHTADAKKMAGTVFTDLDKKVRDPKYANQSEATAWAALIDLVNLPRFELQLGIIQKATAAAWADKATGLALRDDLSRLLGPTLEEAGLTATTPEPVKALAGGEALKEAREKADAAYAAAETTISSLAEKPLAEPPYKSPAVPLVGKSAKVALMQTKWSHAQFLYADVATLKVAGEKTDDRKLQADKLRDEAIAILKNDIPIEEAPAYLPAELAVAIDRKPIDPKIVAAVPGPTTGPTTGPSGEPTTQPTGAFAGVNDSPEQAAVRTVANSYATAVEEGDAVTARNFASDDPAFVDQLSNATSLTSALKQFKQAVATKFADEGKQALAGMNLGDMRTEVQNATIVIAGDTANLTTGGTAGGKPLLTLKNVNGQWKVQPATDPALVAAIAGMTAQVTAVNTVTNDITAGKYMTVNEAIAAFQAAKAAAAGTPTPPAGTTPPTPPEGTTPPTPPTPPAGETPAAPTPPAPPTPPAGGV